VTAPARASAVGRAAWLVSGLTLLSRLSGVVRVVVVTAVLGRTALGDVYQTANLLPNVLFEVLAAGTLQGVLLPALVRAESAGGPARSDRLANTVAGWLLVWMALLTVIGMAVVPILTRAVFAGESDAAVQADKVSLGGRLLLVFLPQVLFYALGLVATAVLQARHRFAAPAVAPLVNNVVVVGSYLLFAAVRDGSAPSLDLGAGEVAILALGTTLGVVAFTMLPVVVAARAGFRWRPNPRRHDPAVPALVRQGVWAGAALALMQVLTVAVLVLGNGVTGTVPTFYLAFTFFQLPFALVAVPVATTVAPSLARAHATGDTVEGRALLTDSTASVIVLLALAGAALVALAWPLVRLVAFGEATEGGLAPLAHAVAAFGFGLAGYGTFVHLTRQSYAVGDAKSPTVATVAVVAVGVAAMVVLSARLDASERAAALAAAYAGSAAVGAMALAVTLARQVGGALALGRAAMGGIGAALVAGGIMGGVVGALDGPGRVRAAAVLVLAGLGGLAAWAAVVRAFTGRSVRALVGVTR
jgi:putative peptidoglycan lipid II flippase